MKVYLAGPLFTVAEQKYNAALADELREAGHEVFLPQDEAKDAVFSGADWPRKVFLIDSNGIDAAEVVVAIMDGTQVDDGTAWECGYACANGKPVLGLRTDFRKVGDGEGAVNLMLAESAEFVTDEKTRVLYALKQMEQHKTA